MTQVQKYSINPFQRDPWFEYFFSPQIRQKEVKGSGSGVVISPDGYILTNDHVVENATKIIVTLPGGKEYNAEVIGMDNLTDLALLKVDGKNFPFIEMANSNELIIFYKNIFFYILNKTLIHREKAPIIIKKMNKDNFFKRFNHIDMINNGGKKSLVKCEVLPFF